jgi:spermidine synthase/MFS family permease
LSGASSLVFQMIWSRLLHHVFGSSSVAISSVVSVFMGGLALGAFLAGRIADKLRRPLLAYAVAELGVALFGLLVPVLLSPEGPLAAFNRVLRAQLGEESFAFMIARFAVILPVLLVPTTLMGATLPILARHFVRASEDEARSSARVGALYATNTAGAVLGVMMAGFVLLPSIGVSATHNVALSCNALLFLVAGFLGRKAASSDKGVESDTETSAVDVPAEGVRASPRTRALASGAFAVSGFCALLYEVVWSRALVNTIGASAYSFALILMTFLLGISGGSAIASSMLQRGAASMRGLLAAALLAVLPSGLSLFARRSPYAALGTLAIMACTIALAYATRSRSINGRNRASRALEALELDALDSDELLVRPPSRIAPLAMLVPPLASALALWLSYDDRLGRLALTLAVVTSVLAAGLFMAAGRLVLQLAFTQLFIAVATLASTLWADQISLTFAALVAPLYEVLADHVDHVLMLMFAMVSLCVLPSALGMGAMFPLTLRAVSHGGAHVGREVSQVYTRNTVGSIAGAWLPGFVLMPALGMQATLHIGIAISALVALALCAGVPAVELLSRAAKRTRAVFGIIAIAVLGLLGASAISPSVERALAWDLTRMTLGVFRIALAKSALDEEAWGEPDIVYYRDGLATTVSVERWGRHMSLKNNGKVEASNGDDMATQINVAALPLLFHRHGGNQGARGLDVAIIGFGSGVTVGAALQFPVRHIDVMELERAVVEASKLYAPVNHMKYPLERFPYAQDPRLTTRNDDGRNYLASTDARYDVIISEPSNPWLTGVADLFTVDHFRIAKRALRPGGVYGQWVQLYELSPENVKIIYRTFAEHFRYVVAFSADDLSSDTILLGSDSPLPFDIAHLEAGMREPRVAAELKRARVESVYAVLGRVLLADRSELMDYAGKAPLNTDDNALIELAAPRDLIGFERYKGYLGSVYGSAWPYGHIADRLVGMGEGAAADRHRAGVALALLEHGRKREAAAVLQRASADSGPELAVARAVLALLSGATAEPALAWRSPPADPTLLERTNARFAAGTAEVVEWLNNGDGKRAHRAALALPDSLMRHAGSEALLLRAVAAYRAGELSAVITEIETLLRLRPELPAEHPEALYYLARAHDALQHFGKGVSWARRYVERRVERPSPGPTDALPASPTVP